VWNGRQVKDQWAYLLRTADERRDLVPLAAKRLDLATRVSDPAEHHRHALLYVRLDHEALEIGLRANEHATIDLANLLARAEADGAGLTAAVTGLPAEIRVGADADPTAGAILEAAQAARSGDAEWLIVARRIPRETATDLGEGAADLVCEVLDTLRPLYRFVCWSAANDHVALADEMDALAVARGEAARAAEAREAEKQQARDTRRETARAATTARVAELEAWKASTRKVRMPPREPAPPPRKKAQAKARPEPRKKPAPRPAPSPVSKPKPAPKPRPAPRPKPAPRAPAVELEVGASCRLTRGLLAGKVGEITAKEARGYYKVRVGTFEVSVAGADLTPA